MNASIPQFWGVIGLTNLLALASLASCTSSYNLAQQKLELGDYQDAEEALGTRTDEKAE